MNKEKDDFESPSTQSTHSQIDNYINEEISLGDIWRALMRQWKMIALILTTSFVVGVYIAITKPKIFEFYTVLEIGNRVVTGDIRPLESASTLKAKIQQSYIPLAQEMYLKKYTDQGQLYKLKATIPKDSQIIRISGEGSQENRDIFVELLNTVIDFVKKDHARLIDIIRKNIEIKKSELINSKKELDDEVKLIKSRQQRLDKKAQLTKERIEKTNELIQATRDNRERATNEANDATHAMTLLMIDNELQQNTANLDELKEILYIDIANQRDELEKSLADIKRARDSYAQKISEVELQLKNLQDTRAIVKPMQSLRPVGVSRKLIVLIFVLMGFVIGVFAGLLVDIVRSGKSSSKF